VVESAVMALPLLEMALLTLAEVEADEDLTLET
jgi:hypothetical protein